MSSRACVLSLVLLVGSLVAVPSTALAQEAQTSFVEPPEYGVDVRHDPFDYQQATDLMTDPDVTFGVKDAKNLPSGMTRFVATGAGGGDWYVSPVWMTFPHTVDQRTDASQLPDADGGALHDQHDGLALPVDADTYTHVSMRFHVDADPGLLYLSWFTCQEWLPGCQGLMRIDDVQLGWNTVQVPIRNNRPQSGLTREWTGTVYGLRLQGVVSDETPITLDWFRLYQGRPEHELVVPYAGNDSLIYSDQPVLDTSPSAGQTWGPLRPRYRNDSSSFVHVGGLPVGTWYVHDPAKETGATLLATVQVRPRPHPEILDPDMAGGVDYATEVLGNPWDFEDPADVAAFGNVEGVRWRDGELSAVNTSNDPWLRLPLGPDGLDPVHYHRVTVDQHYDSDFNLDDGAGATNPFPGGSHGRLIWRTAAHAQPSLCVPQGYSDGREFVFYKTWDTYTYDMANVPAAQGMTSSAEPNLGIPLEEECGTRNFPGDPHWTAKGPLTFLRFDPHEAPTRYRWYVDELRIAADDAADPTFDITWVDHDPIPGTTVTVRLDTNRSGYDGEVLATVDQASGTNRVTFDATDRVPGTYWVNITSRTPDGRVSRDYATGPLQVAPRISGPDRVATAVEMSRQSFDGARTAIVASAESFPDALVAVQLADAVKGPVLLTPSASLDGRVAGELERLGVRKVVMAGGEVALSARVQRQLEATVASVRRVGGATRYETAANLARVTLQTRGTDHAGRVLVTTGENFPDALAAGPFVGHGDLPLVLARPALQAPPGEDGQVPPPVVPADDDVARDFLADVGADRVTVLGGPAALGSEVVEHVAAGRTTDRIAGSDRFDTARRLTQAAVDAGGSARDVLVATGRNYPDALSAGPAALARGGVLVLTEKDAVPTPTRQWLQAVSSWRSWRVVGGPVAVSHATVRQLRSASGL